MRGARSLIPVLAALATTGPGSAAALERPAHKRSPGGESDAPEGDGEGSECAPQRVSIVRAHTQPPEQAQLQLTDCEGQPNPDALDELSILARPDGLERPSAAERQRFRRSAPPAKRRRFVAPDIIRLHPGLLSRLRAIAERWPGERIEIVSGYRPGSRSTSRHHHGRALDIRVSNVHRREVSRFARSLERTGVGFYPNSVFTHIDVRHRSAHWVDRSGPGEPADYGPWPPKQREVDRLRDRILASADEALQALHGTDEDHEPERPAHLTGDGAANAREDADAAERPVNRRADAAHPGASGGCHGGLLAASGVRAAWSSVPAEDDETDDEIDPDEQDGDGAGASTATPDEQERARRLEAEALSTLDRLLPPEE